MNRVLAIIWLAAMLTCAGCVTSAPPEIVPAASMPVAVALPPVTPGQVTEKNGHQVAQALDEEMNREQQQNLLKANTR